MDQTPAPQKRSLPLIIIVFICGALLGGVAGYFISEPTSYQAGFAAAKALVAQNPLGKSLMTPSQISSLTGTVESVQGSTLVLKTPSMDPFQKQSLATRTVTIGPNTGVFNVAPPTGTSSPVSATSTASISSLVAGAKVIVNASENIATLQAFTASAIYILPANTQ